MALTGCAYRGPLEPQLHPADVQQLNGGSLNTSTAEQTPLPWSDGRWWQSLNDPQLDTLIATAVHDSPRLALAESRIRNARALAGAAEAAELPSVTAETDLFRTHFTEHQFIPEPYAGNDYWDAKVFIQTKYALDLWGKDEAITHGAKDELRAAQADTRAAELALQSAVVQAYVQLTQTYALRDIAVDALKLRQQIYDITARRLNAGLATRLDLSQAATALPAGRAAIAELDGRIAVLRTQLAALCGAGPGQGEALSRPTLDLAQLQALPDTIPAHWVGRRPDIAANRWHVEAASEGITAAKAAFYPDINLSLTSGFQALTFAELFNGNSLINAFGPAITLPIFAGGKLRAQLGARAAAYDAAVSRYNDTLVTALQQAASAVAQLKSAETQRSETELALDSAREAYSLAVNGYDAGLTEYLSVISTQSTLLGERETAVKLDAQRLSNYVALIVALGGGFDQATASAGQEGEEEAEAEESHAAAHVTSHPHEAPHAATTSSAPAAEGAER